MLRPGRVLAGVGPLIRAAALSAGVVLAGATATASPPAHAAAAAAEPTITGCPVFPADSPWNQRVDGLPVAGDSAALIARIGLGDPVHPDFGTVYDGAPNGIPYAIVSRRTRRVFVRFQYASESDGHAYPLPLGVPIEGGARSTGDRHVIVVDRSTCTDYEVFAAYPHDRGRFWTAGSGAIFHLRSDRQRPAGWTSADAAGLPILPGLARYSEVAAGAIDHALRFTAPCTGARYVYPARHDASTCGGASAPPMGLRVRLKAGVDISHLPYQARVVAVALKRYGLILADNGSPWYISGAPNRHWNDAALDELDRLTGRDFQVVDTSSLRHPGL
ncbi:MAG TPA: hypothetical protein VG371_17930 [Solirubrobacteraceae bacterium]|jgi:hypothetical protein|nr:hypothetical protein [Solirubrobacteraceae bacterium]